jgi:hypothetical protein
MHSGENTAVTGSWLARLLGQLGVLLTPAVKSSHSHAPLYIFDRESLRKYTAIQGGARMALPPRGGMQTLTVAGRRGRRWHVCVGRGQLRARRRIDLG